MNIQIKIAESEQELQGILDLQKRNFKSSLSVLEARQEGFVTVRHDLDLLRKMNAHEPQVIAVANGKVIGYALVMVGALRHDIPVLEPMFTTLDQLSYGGQPIPIAQYYIMGQVCIDKQHRGQGVFLRLYEYHRQIFGKRYDYCITEVSGSNGRSLRAHEKAGFEVLHHFEDDTDSWRILILPLKD